MLADYVVKRVSQKVDAKSLEDAQAQLLGLFNLLQEDYNHKDTQTSQQLKQVLNKAIMRVKKGLVALHLKEKEVISKQREADDQFSVLIGREVRKLMENEALEK